MTPQQPVFFHDIRATRAEAERDRLLIRVHELEAELAKSRRTNAVLEGEQCDQAALDRQRDEVDGVQPRARGWVPMVVEGGV